MKRVLLAILTLMFFAVSSIAGNIVIVPKSPSGKIPKLIGKIVVTNPHGGDYFVAGNTVQIRWKSVGYIPKKCVSISLFKGNSYINKITNRVCVNGFNWKIPANFTGGKYKIKLTTEDKKVSATSVAFPIIASKPDLSVREFYITPHNPSMGDKVKIGIEMINNGGSKSNGFKAEVVVYKPDNKVLYSNNSINVQSLPSLGGRKIIYIPVTLYKHGKYSVKVRLDTSNSISEVNENNNSKTYYFTVKALPDLVVCVDTDKRPRPLKKVTIRTYVLNRGDVASKPCSLVIAVRDDYYQKMHKYSRSIPSIKPHGVYSAAHVRYRWANMDKSARKKYFYVIVDDKKQVKESNESNNFASGFYYLTRPRGKHGAKNKVSCSWFGPAPVDKSTVGIK